MRILSGYDTRILPIVLITQKNHGFAGIYNFNKCAKIVKKSADVISLCYWRFAKKYPVFQFLSYTDRQKTAEFNKIFTFNAHNSYKQ